MLTIIICVLCGIFTAVQGFPVLDETPLTISVVEGETVILPCPVQNLGRASLIWFSPLGSAIATDTANYMGARYNVTKSQPGDFNLVIQNVTGADAGVYVCMVTAHKAEKRVTLQISSPPAINVKLSSPVLKTIKEGDSLMLRCSATGKPEPVIRWFRTTDTDTVQRTREDLGITGMSFMVRNVTREAAGSYECVASNGLGPTASREIIVTVHFPPHIYPQDDKKTAENGQTSIFECLVEGYPLPKMAWAKDGNVISFSRRDTSKYRPTLYEEKETLIYSLRIDDVNDGDYGVYSCQANNQYGKTSHDYLLEKKGVPKIRVESSLIRKMKSENAELVCRVRGFPKGVVWFKNGVEVRSKKRHAVEQYIEDDVTVSSLTIVQLENSDFANYVCQAYNNYGSDEMDIRLEKLTIDLSGPAKAKLRQEIVLVCNATTNSIGTDSITWLKNGRPLKTSSRISMVRDIGTEDKRIYSKLYIKDMKLGDKGSYTCRTKSSVFKSHTLGVIEVPDPFVSIDKKLSSPTNMQVNENSGAVHLRCAVEGYPRVLITWHKYDGNDDGRKKYTRLTSTDEVLELESDRSVSGTYRCIASNGMQAEETWDITVDVHYPVKVSVTYNRLYKTLSSTLITECNITGNPITRKFWSSTKGPNATFDHTLDVVDHVSYVTVSMKIMTLRLEDFGTYTCIGENHMSNDSASVIVSPIFITTTTSTTTMRTTKPTTTLKTTLPITTTTTTTQRPAITELVISTEVKTGPETTERYVPEPPYIRDTKTTPESEPEPKEKYDIKTTSESEPKPTDKELVKQEQESDENKGSMVAMGQLLLILTLSITFQML